MSNPADSASKQTKKAVAKIRWFFIPDDDGSCLIPCDLFFAFNIKVMILILVLERRHLDIVIA